MKRLLIALMAVALVLVAVSFAAASSTTAESSASSSAGVVAVQTTIPPGGVDITLYGHNDSTTGELDITTSEQLPIQVITATASGSVSGTGTYKGSAGAKQKNNTVNGTTDDYNTYLSQSAGASVSGSAGIQPNNHQGHHGPK